jgi:hypothetical protein
MVSLRPRSLYPQKEPHVPTAWEAGWTDPHVPTAWEAGWTEPVWTLQKRNLLLLAGNRKLILPTRIQSLSRLFDAVISAGYTGKDTKEVVMRTF